ncbi:MAG: hypothetical protein J5606_05735 [Bacteroidales bacterium]|nr:hypothetical protein [Bacteroidales bacterium]
MRKLSDNFIKKLQGEWKPLLEYILSDSELDLQIRDNYINVYYQGGNILKINPRSFYFDEFYFYKDCNKERKTHLQEKAKKGDVNAKHIIDKLVDLRDGLIENLSSPLNHLKVECYFSQAKAVMKKWEETLNDTLKISHREKQEQQKIAITNRKDTDYIVLDLEYAVSRNSKFFYDGKLDKKVPRFDIIAIHNGQLVVIELKKGMDATGGASGVKPHIDCFNHTIGRDVNGHFVQEMKDLLKQKQELGILEKSLKIENAKPKFVFAFADKEEEDKFIEFSCYCFKNKYNDDLIYLNNSHKLNKAMSRDYYYQERKKQINYYNNCLSKTAKNNGFYQGANRKYVLQEKDSAYNLYEDSKQYFLDHKISWWGENAMKQKPSGHLVSSQIHCLNHLFALRKDDAAIKAIIEKATGLQIEQVLVAPLDKDGGYITFEFVCKNKKLLGEKHETRGANCTSVDALVYVQTTDGRKLLIPIEWKYTETYYGKEAEESSLERYPKLIDEKSNLKCWNDLYKSDPYYELMRQTLLVEQIIRHKDCGIEADDYIHIMIIPNEHMELKSAIEDNYIPTLKDKSKFKIIDPEELLSPLKENEKYKDLITYLQTRYW